MQLEIKWTAGKTKYESPLINVCMYCMFLLSLYIIRKHRIVVIKMNRENPDLWRLEGCTEQEPCCWRMRWSPFLCDITKTCLYNFDPLKPHIYIVKLGFTGVYNIFLISAQNIDCGYSLEPPHRGCSNEYPQSMFWKNFQFFWGEIFYIHVFE